MSRTQAALLVLACLLAAAWAARRSGPVLSADVRAARAAADLPAPLPSHAILVQADRLRSRVDSPPPFRPPTRNPFRFSEPPAPPPAPVGKKGVAPAALSTTAVERPERPAIQLVGVAEDRLPDGTIRRTAIVSGMGQLLFAKEGERVLGRYEVVRITPDAAQLKDPDGQTFTLALR